MRVLLISTYELGHQPLHVAAPAARLLGAGHEVRAVDLSVDRLDADDVAWAEVVAWSVPMHTALRLAVPVARSIRELRPEVPQACYGLYAPVAPSGCFDAALAGEYEEDLASWVDNGGRRPPGSGPEGSVVSLRRMRFEPPARHLLPPLSRYARFAEGPRRTLAGAVEATHGCAHRCRHCPVPVVYDGRTRIVGPETVTADVAQLVGLGAGHVSFADPDFLNAPAHARRVVAAVSGAFPELTFDVTVKVEHILAHRDIWPELAASGCRFVTSAFESVSDVVLERLAKGHTVGDEAEAVRILRAAGIEPRPSLLPFTPFSAADDVRALIDAVARWDLIGNVDLVQFAVRLLIPPGSLLLGAGADGLPGLGDYDEQRLGWSWRSGDARLDRLAGELAAAAEARATAEHDPDADYETVRRLTGEVLGMSTWARQAPSPDPTLRSRVPAADRPRLTEAWFCCAEPTGEQVTAATLGATSACGSP